MNIDKRTPPRKPKMNPDVLFAILNSYVNYVVIKALKGENEPV